MTASEAAPASGRHRQQAGKSPALQNAAQSAASAALRLFSLCLLLLPWPSRAADSFADAVALFQARRYPEARAALEKVVAAEPQNAAACHYLGLAWKLRHDNEAYEQALKWLARAVELAPENATYLADFGGTSLQFANRTRSFGAATRGRDAMEKALAMDPENLDAREGLFRFYTEAPWPLSSAGKAAAQLEEIRQRDPERAMGLAVAAKTNAKDYATAFQLCEDALAKNPSNYAALYHYGRTAAACGQNLERALERLKRCLTLSPPGPASPTPSQVWQRIGGIHEQLGQPADARAAYEAALKLDPGNRSAADALARLK